MMVNFLSRSSSGCSAPRRRRTLLLLLVVVGVMLMSAPSAQGFRGPASTTAVFRRAVSWRQQQHGPPQLQQSSKASTAEGASSASDKEPLPPFPSESQQRAKVRRKTGESTKPKKDAVERRQPHLDLPWDDLHAWALRDQLPRFTVRVPLRRSSATTTETETKSFVLWRNLVADTPELQGYPLPFLVERLRDLMSRDDNNDDEPSSSRRNTAMTMTVLPYLDQFCFTTRGGLTGTVYGVPGVADGTRIQTTPVNDVPGTLPHRYVRTIGGNDSDDDGGGGVLYELGQPLEQQGGDATSYPLDARSRNNYAKDWQRNGKEVAANMLASHRNDFLASSNDDDSGTMSSLDPELIQLAGWTGLVVAGAAAVETLSHHLTVNVFWV